MGFTNKGYIKRTAEIIKSDLLNKAQREISEFREWTADIQNNMLDTAVTLISEIENLCGDMANSYGPGYSNDFIWEQLAQSLNLTYKDESKSSVTLLFKGKAGTYIPRDLQVTGGFKTIDSAILDSSGMAYIGALSENQSIMAAGSIKEIDNSPEPDLTVTNPSDSIPYQPRETNQELKLRAQRKIRNARVGSTDYAYSKLLEIPGLKENRINFVITSTTLNKGIEPIILGSNNESIAKALFESFLDLQCIISEPSGAETQRTVNFNLLYGSNIIPIKWTTPKNLNLNIEIILSFRYMSVYSGRIEQMLDQSFKKYINERKVGMPLNQNTLNEIIYSVINDLEIPLQYLSKIEYNVTDKDTGKTMEWDTNNYLVGIEKDIYTTLTDFSVQVVTS